MSIEEKLRNFQDSQRNSGWRIQWIPWQGEGKLEYIYTTRTSNIMYIIGILLFLCPFWMGYLRKFSVFKKYTHSPYPVIIVCVAGLAIIIVGKLYAVYTQQKNWIKVHARCIDREIAEGQICIEGEPSTCWDYRLLCEFQYYEKKYRVTPEASHIVAFNTESAVEKYLNKRITHDGSCILWIDPENPLHAKFHKKTAV